MSESLSIHCDVPGCGQRVGLAERTRLRGGREAPKRGSLDLCPTHAAKILTLLDLIVPDPSAPPRRPAPSTEASR